LVKISEKLMVVKMKRIDVHGLIVSLLIFGMFFTRDENVIVFYVIFSVFALSATMHYRLIFLRQKVMHLIVLYFVFSLYALISVFWSLTPEQTFLMVFRLFVVVYVMYFLCLYMIMYDVGDYIYYGVLAGLFYNVVLFLLDKEAYSQFGRYSGTFHNANYLAIFAVMTMAIVIRRKLFFDYGRDKIINFLCIVMPSLFIVIVTQSRKGFVFALIMLVVSFYEMGKKNNIYKYVASVIVIFGVIMILIFNENGVQLDVMDRMADSISYIETGVGDSSTKWRVSFAELGLKVFFEKPIFGVGLDSFRDVVGRVYNSEHYSHNNYIELLAGLGIIGFVLYYSVFVLVIKQLWIKKTIYYDYVFIFALLLIDMANVMYFYRLYWVLILYYVYMVIYENKIKYSKIAIQK